MKALGNLADAFSIHESKQEFKLQSLPDAILLVERCVEVIQKNTDLIRENDPSLPKSLNGPEGSVSAVSLESLHIVLWALKRLGTISATYNIKGWNLLSCVTLDVENLHSSVNQQQGVQTMLSYAQSFASSVKEALKRTTQWAAYYFTSRQGWYPTPENSLDLTDLVFPNRKSKTHSLLPCQKREMREWASLNGQVVRQRSGRQETTMARAGTLPENAYHEELTPIVAQMEKPTVKETVAINEEDEKIQYSSESDVEDSLSSDDETEYETTNLSREITFAVGTVSRYGRAVRVNLKHFS